MKGQLNWNYRNQRYLIDSLPLRLVICDLMQLRIQKLLRMKLWLRSHKVAFECPIGTSLKKEMERGIRKEREGQRLLVNPPKFTMTNPIITPLLRSDDSKSVGNMEMQHMPVHTCHAEELHPLFTGPVTQVQAETVLSRIGNLDPSDPNPFIRDIVLTSHHSLVTWWMSKAFHTLTSCSCTWDW